MIFSSLFFIFLFLPISLILYLVCPKKAKNVLLVLISLVFFAWGDPVQVLLFLLVLGFNYCVCLDLSRRKAAGSTGAAKAVLVLAVLLNLSLLVYYKYAGMLVDWVNAITHLKLVAQIPAMPIGISFFTFQILSCLFDVYRDKAPAQKNPLYFCMYVTFFPKLISGPIVPYAQMEPQLKKHPVTLELISDGVPLIVIGLAKKVLLADNLATAFASITALTTPELSAGSAWLGALCYTLQLYFDFSGYSDMAIGLSMLFGFRFEKNFDHPYVSSSLTEFWRRWHISLGSWFREYVYFPLGGSRVSTGKCIRNLMVVWLLTGLWHGASLSFLVWGLYHGCLLLLEKYPLKRVLPSIPKFFRQILTFFCVVIGWVFFFSPTLSDALSYLGHMFGAGGKAFLDSGAKYFLSSNWLLLVIGFVCCGPWVQNLYRENVFRRRDLRLVLSVAVFIGLFLLCIPYLTNATYHSFLYSQF